MLAAEFVLKLKWRLRLNREATSPGQGTRRWQVTLYSFPELPGHSMTESDGTLADTGPSWTTVGMAREGALLWSQCRGQKEDLAGRSTTRPALGQPSSTVNAYSRRATSTVTQVVTRALL